MFHPYRALANILGREPADAGRYPKTRVEEDADVRKQEAEDRKKREDEARRAAGPGAAGVKALALPEEEGESEAERVRRLMYRGSGEGLMEVSYSVSGTTQHMDSADSFTLQIDEGTMQIAW